MAAALLAIACGEDSTKDDDCPDGSICPDDFAGDGDGSNAGDGDGSNAGDGDNSAGDGDNSAGDGDNSAGDGDGSMVDGGAGGDGDGDGGNGGDGDNAPPMNGGQWDYCEASADCDMGLDCYTFGNICSVPCQEDADCDGLGGATCGQSGICRVTDCMEDADCPTGLECSMGGLANTCGRPTYEPPPGNAADATFASCAEDADCNGGACVRAACTINCNEDADCDGVGGDLTSSCSMFSMTCSIECQDGDTCPGDSTCQNVGGGGFDIWRCSAE